MPTLISYLLDENSFASANAISKDLHEFALQNLMHIGPLYPYAFKTVMGAAPELKARLETAVRQAARPRHTFCTDNQAENKLFFSVLFHSSVSIFYQTVITL